MANKELKRNLIAQLCLYRAREAAEQATEAERASREQIMVQTLQWQWSGLLTPQEAARLRAGEQT